MNAAQETKTRIPIVYSLEGAATGYATQLIVQHTEHEFMLHFFEIKPPLLLGTPQEQQAQAERIDGVQAVPIASITVSAGRMPEFIQALQDNFENWQSKFSEALDDND